MRTYEHLSNKDLALEISFYDQLIYKNYNPSQDWSIDTEYKRLVGVRTELVEELKSRD